MFWSSQKPILKLNIYFFISTALWNKSAQEELINYLPSTITDRIKKLFRLSGNTADILAELSKSNASYIYEGNRAEETYYSFKTSGGFNTFWFFHDTFAYIEGFYSDKSKSKWNTGDISSDSIEYIGNITCKFTYEHKSPAGVKGLNPYNKKTFYLETIYGTSAYIIHLQENKTEDRETGGLFNNYLMLLLMNIRKIIHYKGIIGKTGYALKTGNDYKETEKIDKYNNEILPAILQTVEICLNFCKKILFDLNIDINWMNFLIEIKKECYKTAYPEKVIEEDKKEKVIQKSESKMEEDMIGKTLQNRYQVIEKISTGGFSMIYKVKDLNLGKYLVLKEMKNIKENKDKVKEFFKREASILRDLKHENIPTVIDYFIIEDKPYLVMEYIEGKTLMEILKEKGKPFHEKEILDWAIELCDVLNYLHYRNEPVVFKDLNPNNIILSSKRKIVLIDFGISRIFKPDEEQTICYTPGYEAPEQSDKADGKATPLSDIYSLGATLHHLLSGKPPKDIRKNNIFPPVQEYNSLVSSDINNIISKALQPEPENRYKSIREMKDDLNKLKEKLLKKITIVSDNDRLNSCFAKALKKCEYEPVKFLLKSYQKEELEKLLKTDPSAFILYGHTGERGKNSEFNTVFELLLKNKKPVLIISFLDEKEPEKDGKKFWLKAPFLMEDLVRQLDNMMK